MGAMCGGEEDIHEVTMDSQSKNQENVDTAQPTEEWEKQNKDFETKKKAIMQDIDKLIAANKGDGVKLKIHEKLAEPVETKLKAIKYFSQVHSTEKGLKLLKKPEVNKKAKTSYEGQKQKKTKHGFGVSLEADGSLFEGHWEKDAPKGLGRLIFADGGYIEGTFEGLNNCTKGVLAQKNAPKYRGEFKSNVPNGIVMEETDKSVVYLGTFVNGEKTGKFMITYENENIFVGEMKSDHETEGTLYYKDGSIYTGEFKKAAPGGKGELKRNGRTYTGQFNGHKLNGTFTMVDGAGKESEVSMKDDVVEA